MEKWLPVVEYEGYYEVSNQGRVRSIDREVVEVTGKIQNRRGRLLTPSNTRNNGAHWYVRLSRDGASRQVGVSTVVLAAFVGPCPHGMEACHFDDNPDNNQLENLRWDTRTANLHDRVRNDKHHLTIRNKCKNGHEFTEENTYKRTPSGRGCRACDRDKAARCRSKPENRKRYNAYCLKYYYDHKQ